VRPWGVTRSAVTGPSGAPSIDATSELGADLIALGLGSGLAAVGIAGAGVFSSTRADLFERKQQGLAADMQFTYRNPERSTDPDRIIPGAKALVVGAWSYRHPEPAGRVHLLPTRPARPPQPSPPGRPPRPAGRVARYARRDHYASLKRALDPIAESLRALGWKAAVVCDDNGLVDRAAAHRAGLGWFGKNSLLLLPGLGSWFVLGSVVTDAPLRPAAPTAAPAHAEGCGPCSRCMTSCPTGALVAPGVLDARRCLAWLVQAPGSFPEQYRRALGDRIYGCDECQQVCPINLGADRKIPSSPPEPDSVPWVDLLDLLGATDDELISSHGRWYIPERHPRYLRRNALVALGNVGDGSDPATEATLRRWLSVDDEMIVEHARWAAAELGRPDLIEDQSEPGRTGTVTR
jgi:epoxyqueuosine reductase